MRPSEKTTKLQRRHTVTGSSRLRVLTGHGCDPTRFEVQKRDETGLIASVAFATERQALAFADSLVHLMAKNGEHGSVQIVWPNPEALT